jgi:hypothetical protein
MQRGADQPYDIGRYKGTCMQRLCSAVFLAVMILSVTSCDDGWTQREKENAKHFLKSLDLVIEAHSTSNSGGAGIISEHDFEKILSLYQRALSEANLVRDDVLAKRHPELKDNYRSYFQKGIALRISAWTNRKPSDEIKGSALMDMWGDWFEKNRRNIKIPR